MKLLVCSLIALSLVQLTCQFALPADALRNEFDDDALISVIDRFVRDTDAPASESSSTESLEQVEGSGQQTEDVKTLVKREEVSEVEGSGQSVESTEVGSAEATRFKRSAEIEGSGESRESDELVRQRRGESESDESVEGSGQD